MGQGASSFTEEELDDYQELTYFTKKEILHAYKRFKNLAPDIVSRDRNAKLPEEKIKNLPELHVNPFRDRICKVFSSSQDGHLTFEDFLDMMSVFSEAAPKSVKTEYAFRIYDFDEDDMLSTDDLREIIKRLTEPGGQKLDENDIDELVENIMNEADLDEDNYLAFAEFEHVISKSPDFMKRRSLGVFTVARQQNTGRELAGVIGKTIFSVARGLIQHRMETPSDLLLFNELHLIEYLLLRCKTLLSVPTHQ